MTLRFPDLRARLLRPATLSGRRLGTLGMLGIACAAITGPASRTVAAEPGQTMFVIDGSGSMWGRLDPDKRAKIDVIRELVRSKIEAADPAAKIGFTSFGHRRRGDCSDVEVIANPGEDRSTILEPLAKLNPRGKGPLANALREAAKVLLAGTSAKMVVIGDGADNCQQDACAAANEIAKSNPGVQVHVIEIGIDPADTPRLACIAKATGGTYAEVAEPDALAKALDAATGHALSQTAGSPAASGESGAPSTAAPPPAGASLRAVVALKDGGAPLNAEFKWDLYKDFGKEPLLSGSGAEITAALEPGSYDIVAKHGPLSARKTITIKEGHPETAILTLEAARVAVTARAIKGAAPLANAMIALQPSGQANNATPTPAAGRAGILDAIVAPGTYELSVNEGQVRQAKQLDLKPGDTVQSDIVLGTGELVVSATQREDGGAIEDVTFIVSEDDPDSPSGRRDVARSRAATANFPLAAGTYYVTARSGLAEVRQRVAVGAGDTVKRALVMPLATVKMSAMIGAQAASKSTARVFRLTELDGDKRELLHTVTPESEITVSPGKYRVSVAIPGYRMSAAQDITAEADKLTLVALKIDAAEVSFKPAVSGPAQTDVYWEIVDATGQAIWRSTAAEPTAIIAPGKYTVRLDARDLRTEAAFEVRGGERRQIELGAR